MTQKQCPCPEAKAGECCKHCPIIQLHGECQPVAPRDASFFPAAETPLYAVESSDEIRPILNGGW